MPRFEVGYHGVPVQKSQLFSARVKKEFNGLTLWKSDCDNRRVICEKLEMTPSLIALPIRVLKLCRV